MKKIIGENLKHEHDKKKRRKEKKRKKKKKKRKEKKKKRKEKKGAVGSNKIVLIKNPKTKFPECTYKPCSKQYSCL
jgi:hypothetical protein